MVRLPPGVARSMLAVAVVLQVAVLYWPAPPGAGAGLLPGGDKAVHLLVFAAVAVTGRLARVPVPLLAGLLVAHAGVSELVQHVALPGRSGDARDLLADVVGVLAGLLVPLGGAARDRAGAAR